MESRQSNSKDDSPMLNDHKNVIIENKNRMKSRKDSIESGKRYPLESGSNDLGGKINQTELFFMDQDRDLFIKLKDFNLDEAEVERAILSRSRQNQKQEIFQCDIFNLPFKIRDSPNVNNEKIAKFMLLEEEAPRCDDKMMNLQNVNTTERSIIEMESFRLSSAKRILQRKLDFL
jgi:hypothetical protein